MVCKEEGDRFFRKPVLVLGFSPPSAPYVAHCLGVGEPCSRGDGRLFATDDKPSAIKFYLNGRGAKEGDEVKGGESRLAECMIHAPFETISPHC